MLEIISSIKAKQQTKIDLTEEERRRIEALAASLHETGKRMNALMPSMESAARGLQQFGAAYRAWEELEKLPLALQKEAVRLSRETPLSLQAALEHMKASQQQPPTP